MAWAEGRQNGKEGQKYKLGSYKCWGTIYSMVSIIILYCILHLKVVQRVDLTGSHHKKKMLLW